MTVTLDVKLVKLELISDSPLLQTTFENNGEIMVSPISMLAHLTPIILCSLFSAVANNSLRN